jgi:hypothetical protein
VMARFAARHNASSRLLFGSLLRGTLRLSLVGSDASQVHRRSSFACSFKVSSADLGRGSGTVKLLLPLRQSRGISLVIRMLDRLARRDRRDVVCLSDRVLALVANRLAARGSEHALAQWLESDFVRGRIGQHFVAC